MTISDMMLEGCEKRSCLSDLIIIISVKPVHNSVPLPPPFQEAVGRIFQNNTIAFLNIDLHRAQQLSRRVKTSRTVLSVTFWRKVGIFSASIGDSSSSDKSSTAFSKSLSKVLFASAVSLNQKPRTSDYPQTTPFGSPFPDNTPSRTSTSTSSYISPPHLQLSS
jgi:hypothetical protein